MPAPNAARGWLVARQPADQPGSKYEHTARDVDGKDDRPVPVGRLKSMRYACESTCRPARRDTLEMPSPRGASPGDYEQSSFER